MTRSRTACLTVALTAALVLGLPRAAQAETETTEATEAAKLGALRGTVRDTHNMPVANAILRATALGLSEPAPVEIKIVDRGGAFQLLNLKPASYSVKIDMAGFTSVIRTVTVNAGETAVLNVTLQTAPDSLSGPRTRNRNRDQDIIAILIRGGVRRPAIHYQPIIPTDRPVLWPSFSTGDGLRDAYGDYSGWLLLYSRSVETAEGALEGKGTQFSITSAMTPDSTVTLRGRFSELATDANSIEAFVEYAASERRRTQIGISLRQVALPGTTQNTPNFSREVRFRYGDRLRWSPRLALEYGAEVGSLDGFADGGYFRPQMSVAWTANPHTTIRGGVTKQDPYDLASRWKNGFDNTVFWQRGKFQRLHGEVAVVHLSRTMTISGAAFQDRTEAQTLIVAKPRGERTLLIINGNRMTTNGVRFEFNRDFEGFSAGASYTTATGIGVGKGYIWTLQDLVKHLERQRFQMLTMRFHANVALTKTELTAVYRLMSKVSGLPLDPYQTFAESNEPTLSVMVAQDLPLMRPFGGKVQAVIDARNIFEPSLSASRRPQLAQAPRMVQGGVNIRF